MKARAHYLLDVNVLVAIFDTQHIHHERVSMWLADQEEATPVSCPITEMGCVRVLSQTKANHGMSISQLTEFVAPFFDRCEHWPCDIRLSDSQRFNKEFIHGHRQLTDIYLLGLATTRNGAFVTLDRSIAIAAVRGAANQHLIVL